MNLCALDREMMEPILKRAAVMGAIGGTLGFLQAVIGKTDKKLVVIAYSVFFMSSFILSSIVHKSVVRVWGPVKSMMEPLCLASAIWNTVEGTIAIVAFRKLGLIGFKGTALMATLYGAIVFYRLTGLSDEWREKIVKRSFSPFELIRIY